MSKKRRARKNRRDRRKAKQSGYAREATKNPKKVAHHAYSGVCIKGMIGRAAKYK